MIEYLILHEVAHHMRCHFDLLDSVGFDIATLNESIMRKLPIEEGGAVSRITYPQLEFDADMYALELPLTGLHGEFPRSSYEWTFAGVSQTAFFAILAPLLEWGQRLFANLLQDEVTNCIDPLPCANGAATRCDPLDG